MLVLCLVQRVSSGVRRSDKYSSTTRSTLVLFTLSTRLDHSQPFENERHLGTMSHRHPASCFQRGLASFLYPYKNSNPIASRLKEPDLWCVHTGMLVWWEHCHCVNQQTDQRGNLQIARPLGLSLSEKPGSLMTIIHSPHIFFKATHQKVQGDKSLSGLAYHLMSSPKTKN